MNSKKIISIIASAFIMITLTGCSFSKNNINKENNKNQDIKIENQEQNNTEIDEKTDGKIEDKKSIEEEKKDIKRIENNKEKINTEFKKESKADNTQKSKVENKKETNAPKINQKPIEKPKYEEKDKKEPVKVNKLEPKKNATKEIKVPQVPRQTNKSFISDIEQIIFRKVNEERAKLGLASLTYNYTMQKYARHKSLDMGSKNYFSHEDLNGQSIIENMRRDGVSFNAWGENIGCVEGYTGNLNITNQFMNTWMNSIGHRKNILSQNFKSIGIGVYKIGNKYYATQEFYR